MTILLAVFCLAAFSTVLADSAEDPILFRGIPWGTNYNDAISEFEGWEDPSPNNISFDRIVYGLSSPVFGDNGFLMQISPIGMKVAGFDLKDIYMYFVYPKDENGSVDKNVENGMLCIAQYQLKAGKDQGEAAREDLNKKLSFLYGESELLYDSAAIEFLAWHGADGTVVTLRNGNYLDGFSVTYSYEGCKELLDNVMDTTGL